MGKYGMVMSLMFTGRMAVHKYKERPDATILEYTAGEPDAEVHGSSGFY
ncbi:hypothetical protein GCM10028868_00870 [Virgibacillus kimchii]